MSDVNSVIAKTIYVQGSRALGISLGLACSIPLTSTAAMARPDHPNADARMQQRQERIEDRIARHANVQLNRAGARFDLGSGRAMFNAGALGNFQNLTIDVGGQQKVVTLDSKLTAGEVVAAQQVLNGGKQSIELRANGAAVGGTVTLNTDVLTTLDKSVGGSISSLTVARGVQVIDNMSGINLSGTLKNLGTISTAADVAGASDTISADNIHNGRFGSIGSYSGSDLFAADVVLNAGTSLTNNGSISSAGNLTINSPVINNVQDGGSSPSITAAQNVNLNTQSLMNTGLIAATNGNVNVFSGSTALGVDGAGGTMQANNGNINFSTNNADINVAGGNLYSQQVNLDVGTGNVYATLDEVSGIVNSTGCVVHLNAGVGDLNLGAIAAYGDPIFTAAGNLVITNAITPTGGAPLTMIAGGNIISNAGNTGLVTTSAVDGGEINLIAGASFKTVGANIVVSKGSKTGGAIDLTGGNGGTGPITLLNSNGGTGKAGNITMIAFGGKTVGTGSVLLPAVSVSADGVTGDGDITIIAGSKTSPAITTAAVISGGKLTLAAGTPVTSKSGVSYDATGAVVGGGSYTSKKLNKADVNLNGFNALSGDFSVQTGAATNVNGVTSLANDSVNSITTATLNVGAAGQLVSNDGAQLDAKVTGATTVDGLVSVGTLNLTTSTLTINATGKLNDAFENITATGAITVGGELGRNPLAFDPTRLATTLNVNTKAAVVVNVGGTISGDGVINSATFANSGLSKGSIAYTVTKTAGKGVAPFSNFGFIDGQNITINALKGSVFNDTGATLQATLQMAPTDIPSLTLNTLAVNNLGHIEAVGQVKQSEGVLTINSTKALTITGVDGGFTADFFSTVALSALKGDITVGGIVGVVNSNPFSALGTGLGNFSVNASGAFESTMPGVSVTANTLGKYGEISIKASSVVYNGVGAAPNFFLNATGDPLSVGDAPVTLNLNGKKGAITIGAGPGEFTVNVVGFDPTSTNTFITPNNLTIDMGSFNINNTSLVLTGTKNFLLTGNLVGGDNVTVNTNAKKEFVIGGATVTGQNGIVAGEGIFANKTLTINSIAKITLANGAILTGGEAVNLNAPALLVNATSDVFSKVLTLNTGAAKNASYTNLNPLGLISASALKINATGALILSDGSNATETVLSVGALLLGPGNLPGGGTFDINAASLKFSPQGIFFIAAGNVAQPNGGEVIINLTGTNAVKVGLGKGMIRADVSSFGGVTEVEGGGDFRLTSAGIITATDVYNGGVNPAIQFGPTNAQGSFELISGATVTAKGVDGIGLNLFHISSNSTTPLLASDASKNGVQDKSVTINGGNIVFENTGALVTNGANLPATRLELSSDTSIDASKNLGFTVFSSGSAGSNTGGEIFIKAPTLKVSGQDGLILTAFGGFDEGAIVDVETTDPTSNLKIDAPGTKAQISINVSNTQNNVGASVSVKAGGSLLVDGDGLAFGAATNENANLLLQSGQAVIGGSGSPLTFNDANSPLLAGLAFGSVTLNSGSTAKFFLDGANVNNGNGLSNGALTAGKVVINPLTGLGIIDTAGYKMVTNDLTLTAGTIFFDNQTIAVVSDGAVGSSNNTGNGGKISVNAAIINFNNAGGVTLQALANGGIPTSLGGTINVLDSGTQELEIGADGFLFNVINAGAGASQRAGLVSVTQSGGDLLVDSNGFAYGVNDGGQLVLKTKGNMLISNIGTLSGFNLDSILLETNGITPGGTSAFQFGSATENGFVDVNPTLTARSVTIKTAGKDAGIDVSFGTIATSNLTLVTTGALNIASGGTLAVLASTDVGTLGNGGTLSITAGSLTQSGGALGFTLAAAGTVGAGGIISLTVTGGGVLDIGAGELSVDISNANGVRGGSLTIANNGDMNVDLNFIDVGANFGGAGPNLSLTANGILAVNNATSIANIGLGGGLITSATIGGVATAGYTNVFNVFDPLLPGGIVSLNYVETPGDTSVQIAQFYAQQINANPDLQALGVSATTVGAVITIVSNSVNTTFSETCIAPPPPADQECPVTVTLITTTTGLTLNSRSSQPFVLGGAAPGTNGIQDSALSLDIGAITIGNTGTNILATIKGGIKAGNDVITVTDEALAGGFIDVSYNVQLTDTHDTIAIGLANAVNASLALQAIGVSATASGDQVFLSATGAGTTFTATPVKGSKIELVTNANGGDISNGDLVSIAGVSTNGVTLNASGSIGSAANRIQVIGGAGSVSTNAGLDAFIFSDNNVGTLLLNAGRLADALVTGGDVNSVGGTAGRLNFVYNNPNPGNTNSVSLAGFTTTLGDLVIASNAEFLNVSGNISSNFGNIVLQNFGFNPQTAIAADTVIHASGAVTALNQGNVYITIGAAPPAFTPADGVAPPGVTITETAGGQVTFASTANPGGSITADPTATFEALGRNLAFSTFPNGPLRIIVGADAIITADPPPVGATVADILAANGFFGTPTSRDVSAVRTSTTAGSAIGTTFSNSVVSNSVPTATTPFVQVDSSTANPFAGMGSALGTINVVNLNNAVLQSELSPLRNATLNSANAGSNAGLLSGASESGTALVNQNAAYDAAKPEGKTLAGGVSNTAHRSLENGPLLLAPQEDVVIDTPHGSISVAAKSLVLVIASDSGLAVYNMHDNRKSAVVVKTGDHSHAVTPGTSSLLVSHSVKSFEDCNPVHFVRYRQPACQPVTIKHKLYRAEFEILSILNGLPAFRDLMVSDNEETRKTMKSVLKTAAILMQLSQGGKEFKHFAPSQVTAYSTK